MTPSTRSDEPIRTVLGACPHDCPDTCSMRISVQGGKVVRIEGNPEHPFTRGALCTKVSRYAERTYHEDRILHPMKRVGRKGAGQFVRVSWDEAIANISQRLTTLASRNPESVLPYSYAGTMGLLQKESMSLRFFHKMGASQLDRTICSSAGGEGLIAVYGDRVGMHLRYFAESKLIVIWGSNSIASNLHFWSIAQTAKRDGAKLICIDPRRTETADKCHEHLQILPGTDGALALGVMHELIVNGWLDQDYIDRHLDGWEALRERALLWPAERTASVCGLEPAQITSLAQDLGNTPEAAIRINYGMQRTRGGGNATRLIALLPCLTGAWRQRSGGCMLTSSGWYTPHKNDAALTRPDLLDGRIPRIINMSTIGDALLTPASDEFGPEIGAVIVYNSNPVAVAPESTKVVRGFEREDLFTVVLEHFMTDTADYADYVLPATTQLEHLDVHTSYGHTDIMLNNPSIDPMGEALPNTEIFRRLAAGMGYTDDCFQNTDEDLARQALKPSVDFASLEAKGWFSLPVPEAPFANGGFPTKSGRARTEGPGLPLADFVPPYESVQSAPDLAERYPLAMISPPARNFLNSSFVNVKSLRAIEGEPLLELSPADALDRQIEDGHLVRVWNDRGSHICRARVSTRARPGVVNGMGIWWRKLGFDGTNVNELTHQKLSDMGRAPCFYDVLVEVEAWGDA